MTKTVSELAGTYLPNHQVRDDVHFTEADALVFDGGPRLYYLTDHAAAAVNTEMGVRPKWFNPVSREQAASERNLRLPVLRNRILLTSKIDEEECEGLVRGMVSTGYRDIPYTFIMECLGTELPAGGASTLATRWSRVTYKYLNVVHCSDERLDVSGTDDLPLHPGLQVINSEVGASSLVVRPVLCLGLSRFPVLVPGSTNALSRIHRCVDTDKLREDFGDALHKCTQYFNTPAVAKIAQLQKITFSDREEVEERLAQVRVTVRDLSTGVRNAILQEYVALQTPPTGVRLLRAAIKASERLTGEDSEGDAALLATRWASGLLFNLLA